jgi:glutamate racemase
MKIEQSHTTSSPDRLPIGVFDSGRGGYYTMETMRKLLPDYDYLFYGDIAHMPYGEYTFAGLERLFSQ